MSYLKKQTIADYEQAVQYLYAVPRFTKKSTMEDTRRHLKALGSPDRGMKIIHIAGTNGKGSVCAYLRGILNEAGYSCGVFTSPHLVECRERFAIDGEIVSREVFYEAFMEVYESLDWEALERGEGYHPTFFEYLFFMGMLIFAKEKPDYCILETGLGGRLDATNAVEGKELAVITRIGMDHMEYLGNTLGEIAGEKAGIIAPGVPVVFLEDEKEAAGVICRNAVQKGAPLEGVSNRDYAYLNFKNKSIDFSYYSRYYGYVRVCLHTIARYQMENASLAIRAAEVLDRGEHIRAEHIINGIGKTFWAGRMEEVRREFYVDGAHNEDGIRAFLQTVSEDGFTGKRHLLCSVVKDKEYWSMIQALADSHLFQKISVAQMEGGRATAADELEQIWKQFTKQEIQVFPSVEEAVKDILSRQEEEERVYAAGSLYLVGEIKGVLKRC